MHSPLLATLTHARLRIAQGDLVAARYILYELLVNEPDNVAAQGLLSSLSVRPAPESSDRDSARRRKISRLRNWAARMALAAPSEPSPGD